MTLLEGLVAVLSWALMLAGSAFVVGGGIGLLRLPDLYTRVHAAGVTDTGGAILIGLALFLQALVSFADPIAAVKVLLILFFTLYTAPTASHALTRTALLSGTVPVGADGEPLLDSPETAKRLARARPDPEPSEDETAEPERRDPRRAARPGTGDGTAGDGPGGAER